MSDALSGRTALVTGASSGLGVDFAREIADRGADVIVVARREERLREVADELEDDYGVDADVITQDLARPDGAEALYTEVADRGHEVDILVNNAGFGLYGNFLDYDFDEHRDLLEVDVLTPMELSKLYAEEMIDRGWGRILQVSSIGAFQPTPTYATYTAAKACLHSWGSAFNDELAGTGVSSTLVCPGPTATEFFDRSGQELTTYQRLAMMQSDVVARKGVRAMLRQKTKTVPGLVNKLTVWMTGFLPGALRRAMAKWTMTSD